jgi:hypothetical protein
LGRHFLSAPANQRNLDHAQQAAQKAGRNIPHRSRRWGAARFRLRKRRRAGAVERHVSFHLLQNLVDVAVQHGDRAEATQEGQGLSVVRADVD